MKYYLSSYRIGNQPEKLKALALKGKIGYIGNARDYTYADVEKRAEKEARDMDLLRQLGLEVELIDLRDYFDKQEELKKKLEDLGAVFISGGNVFVLRQAMKLCGLDKILKDLQPTDFLYAGYSAAGCVLAASLKGMDLVDQLDTPYPGQKEIIWEGLGLMDFRFVPHWDSNHPESADIDKEIAYCKENNITYRAIRDGEVIVIE